MNNLEKIISNCIFRILFKRNKISTINKSIILFNNSLIIIFVKMLMLFWEIKMILIIINFFMFKKKKKKILVKTKFYKNIYKTKKKRE